MSDLVVKQTEAQPVVAKLARPVSGPEKPAALVSLRRSLQRECEVMLHHALEQGKPLQADIGRRAAIALAEPAAGTQGDLLGDVVNLHSELSAAVAPAIGRTLVLLADERAAHPKLYVFGPVRLVRQMLAFAVFALALTCGLSALTIVDVSNVAMGWFALNGLNALAVLAFLLAVAGLGAAFSNLSTINLYIQQANYDPTYEGSYWIRIVLGLIAGVVLGEILFDIVTHANAAEGNALTPAGERIVLAFLGGFATAPVQRLLMNLSDAIGTLLQGRNNAPPASGAANAPPAVAQVVSLPDRPREQV